MPKSIPTLSPVTLDMVALCLRSGARSKTCFLVVGVCWLVGASTASHKVSDATVE